MAKMKALRFERFGPPSVLSVQSVDVPVPADGEVLVEVRASGVNPSDLKDVAGRFNASLPRTPGRDFAGVVVAGPVEIGKQVWGSAAGFGISRDGSHAEFVTMPATWLSEKPTCLSMTEAASVGIPYLTAWSALDRGAELQEHETVLITGVAGAVGQAATQVAHWKRARVIGVGRGKANPGADEFIDSETEDVVARVRALTGREGVDVALDTVGGPLFEVSLRSLRIGGRKIAIAAQGDGRVELNVANFYHNLHRLAGVDTVKLTGPEIAAIMTQLKAGFESGQLRPGEFVERSFDEAIQAYQDLSEGRSRKKQVLVMR
jgi:NADPH:quinone reductase